MGLFGLAVGLSKARFLGGILLGICLAGLHGHQLLSERLSPACNRLPLVIEGTVASLPAHYLDATGSRQQFLFRVDPLSMGLQQHCGMPRELWLSWSGAAKFSIGERWRLPVRLRYPWGQVSPGVFNRQAWYSQQGIDAVGGVGKGQQRFLGMDFHPRYWHQLLRQRLRDRMDASGLSGPGSKLLKALSIGDKSAIDPDMWRIMQVLGINHLMVISGLHIGLAAGVGYLFGRIIGLFGVRQGHLAGPVFALLIAGCYALLAGLSLSTARALIMLSAVIGWLLIQRKPQPWLGLLVAMAGILALQPLAALSSGFWLSFAAVAALLWFVPWQGSNSLVKSSLKTHAYMALVMVPIGGMFFSGFSGVSMLANLLMVPVFGLLVVPAVLLTTLMAILVPVSGAALWVAPVVALNYLWVGLEWFYSISGEEKSWWQLQAPLPALLCSLPFIMLLVVGGLRYTRLLGVLPLLVLPVMVVPRLNEDVVDIWFLDVGQGTAVLVEAARQTLLYDTGGGLTPTRSAAVRVILPLLNRRSIDTLNQLVVSHPDQDHSAGVKPLISVLGVDQFYYGAPIQNLEQGEACVAGKVWQWPASETPVRFTILAPTAGENPTNANNQSCVLMVEVGRFRLLLPGDIDVQRERELIRYWRNSLEHIDLLLVAHHGSNTSSSHAWLKTLDACYHVLTHGYANAFGHPHAQVSKRLAATGAKILSTAYQGSLRFRIVSGELQSVTSWRSLTQKYWYGTSHGDSTETSLYNAGVFRK